MQQTIILYRRDKSNIWDLRETLEIEIAREHAKRLISEGHEVLVLSPEAQTAFFALVPEARALVRTSVIGNKPVFDDWHASIGTTIRFLCVAAAIQGANIVEIAVNSVHPILKYPIPPAMLGPLCAFLAVNLFAVHRLASLNQKVGRLVAESVTRMTMLNNLFPTIARHATQNRAALK